MGRYTGPACRLCRREGMKMCDKHKCASVKRSFPPGMHGKKTSGKKSDYAKQFREKQKVRRIFGLSEKQIQSYYRRALKSSELSGEELIRQCEQRLDNALFRAGFASTRRQARQMVTHGMFTLNGKRINIPSVQVQEGDSFSVRPKSKTFLLFQDFATRKITVPSWLAVDQKELAARVVTKAPKADLEAAVEPQMIIEFYSR